MKSFAIDASRLPDFIELAWALNASDPLWVPPMRDSVARELSPESPSAQHQRRELFLCEVGGRLVGRLAAIVDSRWTDSEGNPIGQLGYYESVNEVAVVRSLLAKACDWLRSQSAHRLIGPINGGAHRSHRFMTDGFDREPFLFEPRNPPYYPTLFFECGFQVVATWHSFDVTRHAMQELAARPGIQWAKTRLEKFYRLSFPDPRDTRRSLNRIYQLLAEVWEGHIGFVHLDADEFAEVGLPLLSLMMLKDIRILVNRDGEDIGFGFAYSDFVKEVRALKGNSKGWGGWLPEARPNSYVLHTVATRARDRQGAALLPILNGIEVLIERDYGRSVVALVTDNFRFFQRRLPATRTYALLGLETQT